MAGVRAALVAAAGGVTPPQSISPPQVMSPPLSWRLQAEAVVANGCADDLQIVLFHPEAVHSACAPPRDSTP